MFPGYAFLCPVYEFYCYQNMHFNITTVCIFHIYLIRE